MSWSTFWERNNRHGIQDNYDFPFSVWEMDTYHSLVRTEKKSKPPLQTSISDLPSMAGETKNLHIALFPWLAFGHILPFLHLSISLAQRGHRISFISTPRNLQRLPTTTLSSLITLFPIPLPLPLTTNLPPHAESTADIAPDQIHYLWEAFDSLQHPLTTFLQSSRPDWLIYDFAPYWLPPVASKLDIPCVYLNIYNASMAAFYGPVSELMAEDPATRSRLDFTVPPTWIPFPSNLALRPHEARKRQQLKKATSKSSLYRFGAAIQGSKLMAVRTCVEFEGEWLDLIQHQLYSIPVLPIGLLVPPRTESEDPFERAEKIKEWLDKQSEKSVVFVAFGSESELSQEQFTELAHGLELSDLPFLWAVRKQPGVEAVLPTGFEERVKDRGYVTTDWVPQLGILAHRSVGGFLTHSGWSSVIEGLGFGLGLILLPLTQPQGLHARILVEKEIGLEIARDEVDGSFSRDSVCKSVRVVMVEEEGELFRRNAKEMRKVFGDFELQDRYLDNFDRYLREYK